MKKIRYGLWAILACLVCICCAASALGEQPDGESPDLALCGGLVWRFRDGAVVLEDVEAGEAVSTLALSDLYEAGARLKYASITSWTEDSVLLSLALQDAANAPSFRLVELGLVDGAPAVIRSWDSCEKLRFLAEGNEWYEVDTVGCGQRLFIAALDADYLFHFFAYAPDGDALAALGERSLDSTIAVLPYGDGMLIAGPDPMDDGRLELTRLSLEDGATTTLDTIRMDSAVRASNFAWDESAKRLYYTSNNTVYALSPGSGEAPEAVGMLPAMPAQLRVGALVVSRYAALGEQGQLLSCDISAPVALTAQLRVANIAGDEAIIEAARDFSVVNAGCSVSIADAVTEADLLAQIKAGASDYDAFVLNLGSALYQGLSESGLMADLSANAALSSAVEDMTPKMAAAIRADGRLCAMPMAVGNYCQLLNVPAAQALTGLSRDALPTDWPGFLALLEQLAESGALTGDGEYCLYDADMPAEGLREMLLSWMLQDCLLLTRAEGGTADGLSQAMLPALEAFDRIDWSRLASPAEPGGSGRTALLIDGLLDIVVTPQVEGAEIWPLSVSPNGQRLIAQVATVLCVNAGSASPEAALAFVAHAWEKAAIEGKMALCQSMNTPVANTAYQEDMAYMAEDEVMLRQYIETAQSNDERSYLQEQLDQLHAYMEDYRQNGRWLASEESIARYRRFADALVPVAPDFGLDDALYGLMDQYLGGALTAQQFADRFAEAVK